MRARMFRILFMLLLAFLLPACSIPRAAELTLISHLCIPNPPRMTKVEHAIEAIPAIGFPSAAANFESTLYAEDLLDFYRKAFTARGWNFDGKADYANLPEQRFQIYGQTLFGQLV